MKYTSAVPGFGSAVCGPFDGLTSNLAVKSPHAGGDGGSPELRFCAQAGRATKTVQKKNRLTIFVRIALDPRRFYNLMVGALAG